MKSIRLLLTVAAVFAATGASALDKTTVVLDWTVNTNHTGLYVAQAQGWFKDVGLDVDIQPAPDSGAAGLLASGRADFAYSYQEEILQSRAGGLALTAVAAVIQNNTSGFASRKAAGIQRPKDFEGKRYGGWGSPLEEATLKTLMKAILQSNAYQRSSRPLPGNRGEHRFYSRYYPRRMMAEVLHALGQLLT